MVVNRVPATIKGSLLAVPACTIKPSRELMGVSEENGLKNFSSSGFLLASLASRIARMLSLSLMANL